VTWKLIRLTTLADLAIGQGFFLCVRHDAERH